MREDSKTGSKILIIHQGALGDFVIKFPAILRLRKYFDGVDAICESQLGKLAAELRVVDRWFPLEAANFSSLFTDRFDQKIKDLLKVYTKIVLFSFSQPLEKSINKIAASPCLRIPPKPPPEDRIHITEFTLQRLVNGGLLEETDMDDDDRVSTGPPEGLIGNPGSRKKIFIHPGAGSIRKRWPIAGFFKVAEILKIDGLVPEFILGPAERDLADKAQNRDRNVHVLNDLRDLAALLKSGGAYIGNDSGVSHLAAFLGLPATVIFGPADLLRWKPNGCAVAVVHPAPDCEPCFETAPANCVNPKCLDDITPEAVVKAFYSVYNPN